MSKGQKARAGLLVALAYRPELLVLDEPSSGLEPLTLAASVAGAEVVEHKSLSLDEIFLARGR